MSRLLSLAVCALIVAPLCAGPVLLHNPQPIPIAGMSTQMLLTADFDGDGHPDLLVVHPRQSLEVILSRGNGSFAQSVVTPFADYVNRAALADVDKDGHVDFIYSAVDTSVSPYVYSVVVLRGLGDGSFAPYASVPTMPAAGPVAAGDFNGDGNVDLAVGEEDQHSGENIGVIHFGDGHGGFSAAVQFTSTPQYSPLSALVDVVACDVNGDGKLDLLVESWSGGYVYLNAGDGTFTRGSGLPYVGFDGTFSVADLNGDGKPDIAVTQSGTMTIAFGTGDGSYTFGAQVPIGLDSAVSFIDMDGDRKLDVVGASGNTIGVAHGNGDGTFAPLQYFTSGPGIWQVVAGDFDWDGAADVVSLDYNMQIPALSFLHGNADGTFRSYRAFAANLSGAVVADMNGDGKLDVVGLAGHAGRNTLDIVVMAGDGTGKLSAVSYTDSISQSWSGGPLLAVGDLNGDGHPDVVVVSNFVYAPTVVTFLGNGDGTFSAPLSFSTSAFGQPVLVDLTGDGKLDLYIPSNSGAQIYPGNGNGTFGSPMNVSGVSSAIAFADVNGDGKLDIVSISLYDVAIGLNDGTGNFTFTQLGEYEPGAVVAGDFDGDGKLDLVIRTYTGLRFRAGRGDGTFAPGKDFRMNPLPSGPTVTADFDGDGHLDVAFGTTIYLGNGDGTFRGLARYRANPWPAIAAGDFNGDGAPDLVTTSGMIEVFTVDRQTQPVLTSSTQLATDNPSVAYGTAVKLTATVSGNPLPVTGAVVFTADGVPYGMTEANAQPAVMSLGFAAGTHSVAATYSGDDNYGGSSASVQQTVVQAATTISAYASPNPTPALTTVTFVGSRAAPVCCGLPGPTGSIVYSENGAPLVTTPDRYGNQTISTLAVGTHHIVAVYPGDTNYAASNTVAFDEVITKPVPQMTISETPSTVMAGEPFTIAVTFAPSFTDATGTIMIQIDAALLAVLPVSGGSVQQTTSFSGWGTHTITARYSGDVKYAASVRAAQLIVNLPWGSPLQVNATSTWVTWSHVVGAASYTIYTKTAFANAWTTQTVGADVGARRVYVPFRTTWMFAVTATDAYGNQTPMSAPDLATGVGFTDPQLVPGLTMIRAVHFGELRWAVDAVRAFAGLAPYPYSAIAALEPVRAMDVMELRAALSEARSAIGMPIVFSDPVLTPGTSIIRALHIQELRAGTD